MYKIRNGKVIHTARQELLKTMIDYFAQLYENKCENLDEMDSFLRKYNLPKMIPAKTRSLTA